MEDVLNVMSFSCGSQLQDLDDLTAELREGHVRDLRPFHTRPKNRIQCASNAHSSHSHLNPVWAMHI